MTFGQNLRQVLSVLDMSQADLAKRTDLTPAAISQILNDQREPSLSTIVAILKAVPVKFERLIK